MSISKTMNHSGFALEQPNETEQKKKEATKEAAYKTILEKLRKGFGRTIGRTLTLFSFLGMQQVLEGFTYQKHDIGKGPNEKIVEQMPANAQEGLRDAHDELSDILTIDVSADTITLATGFPEGTKNFDALVEQGKAEKHELFPGDNMTATADVPAEWAGHKYEKGANIETAKEADFREHLEQIVDGIMKPYLDMGITDFDGAIESIKVQGIGYASAEGTQKGNDKVSGERAKLAEEVIKTVLETKYKFKPNKIETAFNAGGAEGDVNDFVVSLEGLGYKFHATTPDQKKIEAKKNFIDPLNEGNLDVTSKKLPGVDTDVLLATFQNDIVSHRHIIMNIDIQGKPVEKIEPIATDIEQPQTPERTAKPQEKLVEGFIKEYFNPKDRTGQETTIFIPMSPPAPEPSTDGTPDQSVTSFPKPPVSRIIAPKFEPLPVVVPTKMRLKEKPIGLMRIPVKLPETPDFSDAEQINMKAAAIRAREYMTKAGRTDVIIKNRPRQNRIVRQSPHRKGNRYIKI